MHVFGKGKDWIEANVIADDEADNSHMNGNVSSKGFWPRAWKQEKFKVGKTVYICKN